MAMAYLMNAARAGTAADSYFVDDTGQWMNYLGDLVVDANDEVVTQTNTLIPATVDPTRKGGGPVRVSGSVIDTGVGGAIKITGSGGLLLDGIIGQVADSVGSGVIAHPAPDRISARTAVSQIVARAH